MELWIIGLFTLIAFITSFFSVMMGGAGLILTPLMLSFGIPPANAIPSAKFSFLGTSASGTIKFHRSKKIDYKLGLPLAAFAVIGGIIGSNSVMKIHPEMLKAVIGVTMLFILFITLICRDLGESEHPVKMTIPRMIFGGVLVLFGMMLATVTGGGSSVLNTYILVLLFGENFLHSAGTQSIINDIALVAIVGVFMFHGMIEWVLAIPLFLANILGAWLGSSYSLVKGSHWVKNVFVVVLMALSVKLIFPLVF